VIAKTYATGLLRWQDIYANIWLDKSTLLFNSRHVAIDGHSPQEMNVQVTFIERSPRAYTRTSGVRRDHREREHIQARERSRA